MERKVVFTLLDKDLGLVIARQVFANEFDDCTNSDVRELIEMRSEGESLESESIDMDFKFFETQKCSNILTAISIILNLCNSFSDRTVNIKIDSNEPNIDFVELVMNTDDIEIEEGVKNELNENRDKLNKVINSAVRYTVVE